MLGVQRLGLLDQLVCAREQRRRDRQPEGLGDLDVDDQLERSRLLDGEVGGLCSYRRDDTAGDARSIRDALAKKFGAANVFMDVDNLKPGQRFDVELAKALDACDVFITIIGPRWYDLAYARAQLGGLDYVREEIAAALARGIAIIPILMDDVVLPRPETLRLNGPSIPPHYRARPAPSGAVVRQRPCARNALRPQPPARRWRGIAPDLPARGC
jgi:hypothetical protein